ncbi:GyrI-like domain-containing protein [Planctomycetota bacterium]
MFRGMLGESLQGHIRRLRLERAATLLKNGKRSVTDIAFEACFESHEAFTRAFRTMFGVAPRDFRKSFQAFSAEDSRVHYHGDDSVSQLPGNQVENENMKVEIVAFDPIQVAYVHHVGPYNQCGQAWETLCTWAGPQGLIRPGCKFLGLCYDDPEVTPADKVRYDACISVDNPMEPSGKIGVKTIERGHYAMATHFGPYEKLSQTYAQLCGQWAPDNGYEIASLPSIEIYQNSPEDTDPEDLITDIHIPLEAK